MPTIKLENGATKMNTMKVGAYSINHKEMRGKGETFGIEIDYQCLHSIILGTRIPSFRFSLILLIFTHHLDVRPFNLCWTSTLSARDISKSSNDWIWASDNPGTMADFFLISCSFWTFIIIIFYIDCNAFICSSFSIQRTLFYLRNE